MGNVKKILVVDDEEALCDGLGFNLEAEGYAVDCAYSAEEALALNLGGYDLVLLDIMMGEISGIQLARIMKSNPATASVPIIFCTARDTEEDMIAGLDVGADDYIMKPYSLKAVLARVRAVLRRTSASVATAGQHSDLVSYKGLVLSARNRTCMPYFLFRLLSKRGQVFTRADLLSEIWPDEVVVLDRVVDVNITRIRQKIGLYGKNIVTRSGYGYVFVE